MWWLRPTWKRRLNFQNGGDVVPLRAVVDGKGDTHWVSDWLGWRRVGQTGDRQRISGKIRRKSMSVPRFAASGKSRDYSSTGFPGSTCNCTVWLDAKRAASSQKASQPPFGLESTYPRANRVRRLNHMNRIPRPVRDKRIDGGIGVAPPFARLELVHPWQARVTMRFGSLALGRISTAL